MTTVNAASDTGLIVAGIERRTGTLAGTVRQAWENFLAYRATLVQLRGLSDKDLADVGMRRDQIKHTARRAVYDN